MEDKDLEIFTKRLTDAQQDMLHVVSAALVAHPDDVRDVLQNANYALIAHASEYRPDRPFLPWALAFVKLQILAYCKARGRDRLVFDDELLDLYAHSAFEREPGSGETPQRVRHLYSCLDKLPPRQRELVNLHYFKGRPLTSIAAETRKPESTVHMTLFRARQALADCIKRLCRLDGGEDGKPMPPPAPFDELTMKVIDSPRPDRKAVEKLLGLLHADHSLMDSYAGQMEMHLLLSEQAELAARMAAEQPRRHFPWLRAAAALAFLLAAGAGIGWAGQRLAAAMRKTPTPAPAVEPTAPATVAATVTAAVTVATSVPAAAPITIQSTKEVTTNMNSTAKFIAAAALGAAAATNGLARSNAIRIDANPSDSDYWRTIRQDETEISWFWPDGSAAATLTVADSNGKALLSTNLARAASGDWTNCVWKSRAPADVKEEDVLSIRIAFTDADGSALTGYEAKGIGRVGGIGGTGTRLVCNGTANDVWTKAYAPHMVMPILPGTLSLTLGTQTQALTGVPGWYLLSPIENQGIYSLLYTIEGGFGSASLIGVGRGTMFSFH